MEIGEVEEEEGHKAHAWVFLSNTIFYSPKTAARRYMIRVINPFKIIGTKVPKLPSSISSTTSTNSPTYLIQKNT